MQHRKDKYGNELSMLGFGGMRFTKKGNAIDIDKGLYSIPKGLIIVLKSSSAIRFPMFSVKQEPSKKIESEWLILNSDGSTGISVFNFICFTCYST